MCVLSSINRRVLLLFNFYRPFRTVLNRSDEHAHSRFVPGIRGNEIRHSLSYVTLPGVFLACLFICVVDRLCEIEKFPFCS